MPGLFTRSGGVHYHYKAFRLKRTLWTPFCLEVARWLEEWEPGSEGLVIFGPSGGYTLPTPFLKKFKSIVAVDFDPLAPLLFKLYHPGLLFEKSTYFTWVQDDFFDVDFSDEIRRRYPRHSWLFSNVIGQLLNQFPLEERRFQDWLSYLGQIDDRPVASYHDLVSFRWRKASTKIAEDFAASIEKENLLQRFDVVTKKPLTVLDHGTETLWQERPCRVLRWDIVPGRVHLIACKKNSVENKL